MSDTQTTETGPLGKKDFRAFRLKRDTTLPKASFYIGENADGTRIYDTVGVSYVEGSYVIEEDIAPNFREMYDDGKLDKLLEEVDREEALAVLNFVERGTFAPEHSVEAEALAKAGHRILDRETVIEIRSMGADDARAAQEAAKGDGADSRPGLTVGDNGHNQATAEDGEVANALVVDAQYVDAEQAVEEGVQVLPSGVMAVQQTEGAKANPFVEKSSKSSKSKSKD